MHLTPKVCRGVVLRENEFREAVPGENECGE